MYPADSSSHHERKALRYSTILLPWKKLSSSPETSTPHSNIGGRSTYSSCMTLHVMTTSGWVSTVECCIVLRAMLRRAQNPNRKRHRAQPPQSPPFRYFRVLFNGRIVQKGRTSQDVLTPATSWWNNCLASSSSSRRWCRTKFSRFPPAPYSITTNIRVST